MDSLLFWSNHWTVYLLDEKSNRRRIVLWSSREEWVFLSIFMKEKRKKSLVERHEEEEEATITQLTQKRYPHSFLTKKSIFMCGWDEKTSSSFSQCIFVLFTIRQNADDDYFFFILSLQQKSFL